MKRIDRAEAVFHRSVTEALGYLRLAIKASDEGNKSGADKMGDAAIAALRRFSDNDDLIDAMMEADKEEIGE